ncbi:MAG: VOC family protein [bacterium]|nr:VOC family protein [bacterium]
MNRITPCLWFDHQAAEAAEFYCRLFKNSRILATTYYPKTGQEITGGVPGSVLSIDFELDGQPFMALNGGNVFQFTSAISWVIDCADQAEVDYYWETLLEGGQAQQCGWLTDRFGVTWQVVPSRLNELFADPQRKEAVMAAMLKMVKLDVAALEAAGT